MGTLVDIPHHSRMPLSEMPYWTLQCTPDRIKYDMGNTFSIKTFLPVLTGPKGHHLKIIAAMEQLIKMNALSCDGKLTRVFQDYVDTIDTSADPRLSQRVFDALETFREEAHKKKNYLRLPRVANRVKFFIGAPNLNAPRLTPQEHQTM